ncbi:MULTISPECIES: PAAR domain-containing protein [unclassified Burkholderia]|uniref:PAAR domain-containing protein n=1 Tax=unclassified Burkholderia TaxID=2613784 RepID=UPI00142197FD|nr:MULTISPECIES: PAAR domain-containing protein [unclassified Burkholderia]NIE56727.1 PAAR domain-containing protein [Burkholderia sp. Ap-955]NIF08608.1 PAAR domain-containing protein [Burkholderia sp. Ax-1735]NIG01674.1 PAAR domain-containing protein [Burkholderia sp. Tr-849]
MTTSIRTRETDRARQRKAVVRDGDPTTTRGLVIARSSTMFDHGKHIALSEDRASCGICEGHFSIVGTGKGISEGGRNAVVDGDSVSCPCGKNRVMAGSDPSIFLERQTGCNSTAFSPHEASATRATYDEQFQLIDQSTGHPLEHVRYRITSDVDPDSIITGTTDMDGRTRRVSLASYGKLHLDIVTG